MRFLIFCLILFSINSQAFTLASTNTLQRGWGQTSVSLAVNTANCPSNIFDALAGATEPWNTVTASNFYLGIGGTSTATPANLIAGAVANTPVVACDTNFQTDTGMNANSVSAYAQVVLNGNMIVHGYLLLNVQAGASGNISNISTERLKIILAHELGHIVGLGQSTDANALMYHDLSFRRSPTLGQDDIDGVTYLYQRNEPPDGVLGCGLIKSTHNNWPGFPLLIILPIIFWLSLRKKSAELPCAI